MIAIAFLFVHVLCDCFKSRRRLEAEVLVLRHQLNVLRRIGRCALPIPDAKIFKHESWGPNRLHGIYSRPVANVLVVLPWSSEVAAGGEASRSLSSEQSDA
jgi:hypothetical protein